MYHSQRGPTRSTTKRSQLKLIQIVLLTIAQILSSAGVGRSNLTKGGEEGCILEVSNAIHLKQK